MRTQSIYRTASRLSDLILCGSAGRTFEAMFGSFEAFIYPYTLESFADEPENLAAWRRLYDHVVLYAGHEAVAGSGSTDVQTCNGDSGGPLARFTVAGGWETYGVASGGTSSARSQCDHGTVYSTFGPETLAFLEEQLAWVDPCGAVPATGECYGDVARRCDTNVRANTRRIVEDDCAAAGQRCVSSEAGAGCGRLPAPEPQPPEARQRLLDAIARAARPPTVLDSVRPRP